MPPFQGPRPHPSLHQMGKPAQIDSDHEVPKREMSQRRTPPPNCYHHWVGQSWIPRLPVPVSRDPVLQSLRAWMMGWDSREMEREHLN